MKTNTATHCLKETSRLKPSRALIALRHSQSSLCLALFLAVTNPCFSQGAVNFRNSSTFSTPDPTGGNRLVYDVGSPLDPVNGAMVAGTQWVAELYAGADAASLSPVTASITRFRATTSFSKGKWGFGTIYGVSNDPTILPFPWGTPVTLMVKVWDFSQFATYEDASAQQGLTGASDPFAYQIPASGDLDISKSNMEGLRAFALGTPPEGCVRHKAQATAQLVNGSVAGATVTDAGCGYTNPPAVLIQGGGGTGATATAVISGTQVTAINITSGGCCYTNAPTIIIASPWFKPTVTIGVSRVKVMQHVVLRRTYVLESSYDQITWTPTGPAFTAQSENIENVFDVGGTGGFFRVREVP